MDFAKATSSGESNNGFIGNIKNVWDAHQQFHDDIRNNVASLGESPWGVYAGTESIVGIGGTGLGLTAGGVAAAGTGTVAGAATGVGLIVIGTEVIWVGVDIAIGMTKGPKKAQNKRK